MCSANRGQRCRRNQPCSNPANPLNWIYGTVVILVISVVTHFCIVSRLTAVTALKLMDREVEPVFSSLKQPTLKLFRRVTVPVCMPAVLNMDDANDIATAAAMGKMIFHTKAAARILHLITSKGILRRPQAWRAR